MWVIASERKLRNFVRIFTIGTTARQILEYSLRRTAVTLTNLSSGTIYVSHESAVTTSTGYPIGPTETLSFYRSLGDDTFLEFHVIADAASQDLRVIETLED